MIHGTRRDHPLELQDGLDAHGGDTRKRGYRHCWSEPKPRACIDGRRICSREEHYHQTASSSGCISPISVLRAWSDVGFGFRRGRCIHGSSTRRRAMRSGTARASSRGRTKARFESNWCNSIIITTHRHRTKSALGWPSLSSAAGNLSCEVVASGMLLWTSD
jgi:hypothetical protein